MQRDAADRRLSKLGEESVVAVEQRRLTAADKMSISETRVIRCAFFFAIAQLVGKLSRSGALTGAAST